MPKIKNPNIETISLENMRLFAVVAKTLNFTEAGRVLDMPKQTLSRRIATLERSLGVQLLQRTTRKMQLTDVGASFAERCWDIVRRADEATRAVTDTQEQPQGRLRVTADPVFGEAFVSELVIAYARQYPDVELEVVLTRRHVDLIEEGFDVAFRVGHEDRAGLQSTPLMPARVQYCASPNYLRQFGVPAEPDELSAHSCILVLSEGTSIRWPFRSRNGSTTTVNVTGRLRFTNFTMAHEAALAGLGIAIFPEFKCALDIAANRLVSVLSEWCVDVGTVSIVYPTQRFLAPRVRRFIEMATGAISVDRGVTATILLAGHCCRAAQLILGGIAHALFARRFRTNERMVVSQQACDSCLPPVCF